MTDRAVSDEFKAGDRLIHDVCGACVFTSYTSEGSWMWAKVQDGSNEIICSEVRRFRRAPDPVADMKQTDDKGAPYATPVHWQTTLSGTHLVPETPEQSAVEGSEHLAGRTPQDYAIEFGRDMATCAEAFMRAVNKAEVEVDADCWSALESAIYEFRKRADRAEIEAALAVPAANGGENG